MGFRFSLKSANIVANLTFGKVISCYNDIFSSNQNFYEFINFLERFEDNIYFGKAYQSSKTFEIKNFVLKVFRQKTHSYFDQIEKGNYDYAQSNYDENILIALKQLSDLFSKCKIKSLLLPGLNGKHAKYFIDERLWYDLIEMHPYDSCLILQPDDCPNSPTIFNAFPHFEIALKQADLWPAVFFWTGKTDYAFIPVKNQMEINNLFKIIKYEKNPMELLKSIAASKIYSQQYIFQLSDLHIGDSKILCGKKRLMSLIEKHLKEIQPREDIKFLITGDAVDSPNDNNEMIYNDFSNYIEKQIGTPPNRGIWKS